MKINKKNNSKLAKFAICSEKASKIVGGQQEGGPRAVIIQTRSEEAQETEGGPRTVII